MWYVTFTCKECKLPWMSVPDFGREGGGGGGIFKGLVLCESVIRYIHIFVHISTYTDLHYAQFVVPLKFCPNSILGITVLTCGL